MNLLKFFIVKFSDRPSSSDASDFNKLEKLDILAKIEVGNSHTVLERIEIENIRPIFISYAMLASDLLEQSENFKIESCRGFSRLQFECLFRQIGQIELDIYSKTSEQL